MNAKMSELRSAFEAAGFADVRTVLSSGNVVFGARAASAEAIARKAERAMNEGLGRMFLTIVRSIDALETMVAAEPFSAFRLPAGSKHVVTFLRQPPRSKPSLPIERDGARILRVMGSEVFSSYVPTQNGPDFMAVIEKAFGKEVTTRTWDTVKKVVAAGRARRT